MQAMKDFVMYVFSELPNFLMAEPICCFVGLFIVFVCISAIRQIVHIH